MDFTTILLLGFVVIGVGGERLDFAERVLAQSEQPARLPGRLDP
jgi:hypothetical protein